MSTRTYTKSIYTAASGTTDTKYFFSDGETWTVDNHTGRRRVAYQDFEGDNMHRGTLATLDYRIKAAEQVGETETLESPATSTSEPVLMQVIDYRPPTLDPRLPVLDAVEIPWEETADVPELPEAAREALAEDPERFAANLLQQVADLAEDMRELDTAAGNWRASYYAERDRADKADRELAIALLRIRELEASEGSEVAPRV